MFSINYICTFRSRRRGAPAGNLRHRLVRIVSMSLEAIIFIISHCDSLRSLHGYHQPITLRFTCVLGVFAHPNSAFALATQYCAAINNHFNRSEQARQGVPQLTDDGVLAYVEVVSEEQRSIAPLSTIETTHCPIKVPLNHQI